MRTVVEKKEDRFSRIKISLQGYGFVIVTAKIL
jgi:hypothetical protein